MTPTWTPEQDAALRDWHMAAQSADTPGAWAPAAIRHYLDVQRRCAHLGLDLEDLRMWRMRDEQS